MNLFNLLFMSKHNSCQYLNMNKSNHIDICILNYPQTQICNNAQGCHMHNYEKKKMQ